MELLGVMLLLIGGGFDTTTALTAHALEWLSGHPAERDPAVFEKPNDIDLARTGNRHYSFGLGIHRCIGSNMARMVFKQMVTGVADVGL
jgi:cytochrome P450